MTCMSIPTCSMLDGSWDKQGLAPVPTRWSKAGVTLAVTRGDMPHRTNFRYGLVPYVYVGYSGW